MSEDVEELPPDVARVLVVWERRVEALRAYVQHYEPDTDLRFIDTVTTYEAGDGHGAGQFEVYAAPGLSSPVALTHEALTVLLGPRQAYELAQAVLAALCASGGDMNALGNEVRA